MCVARFSIPFPRLRVGLLCRFTAKNFLDSLREYPFQAAKNDPEAIVVQVKVNVYDLQVKQETAV
jgi:hypothetical protein